MHTHLMENKIKSMYRQAKKNIHNGNIYKYYNRTKTTCMDFYWHIINTDTETPTAIYKWYDQYTNFDSAGNNIWSRIFKLPFKIVRDTKIQTFQNNFVCRIIQCNNYLYVTLKLKTVKLVTTVVKLMTVHISSKNVTRLMSSGLTGSIGENISVA